MISVIRSFGMLCTGDVEEKGEEILLEQVEKNGVFGSRKWHITDQKIRPRKSF